jgi:glutamyl-tRNA reductase
VGRLIRALRQRLTAIGDDERQRTLRKLAAADPDKLPAMLDEATAELTHRLINKILHEPLAKLNQESGDAPLGFYAAALRGLFALEEGEEAAEPTREDDRATAADIDQHVDEAPRESTAKR